MYHVLLVVPNTATVSKVDEQSYKSDRLYLLFFAVNTCDKEKKDNTDFRSFYFACYNI